jgi:predicted RND superfamily exporter protein
MLVPFLIFAIGISHGVQKINGIALQSSDADNALTAARRTFRQLFLPGMIAILADAVGFITLLIIDIGVIRELAIGASIGVAVIVFTNLILLPVAISYVGISKRPSSAARRTRPANTRSGACCPTSPVPRSRRCPSCWRWSPSPAASGTART